MKQPPHTCPLSGVPLRCVDLIPAPEVTERALAWCAVNQPEAAELFLEPPPEEAALPPPPPPPPNVVCDIPDLEGVQRWSRCMAASSWASFQVFVAVINVCLRREASGRFDAAFPLHNLGARYGTQPWRAATCLFTNTSLAIAVFMYLQQLALLIHLQPRGGSRKLLARLALAGLHGSFAAGVAFPDRALAGGATLTSVMAVAALVRPGRARCWVAATLVFSVFFSLSPHCELLSHLAALAYYAALSVEGRRRRWALAGAALASLSLVILRALGLSATWLAPALAPELNYAHIYNAVMK